MPVGRVLVDSGPLIALFNGADRWHKPVLAWLQAHPAGPAHQHLARGHRGLRACWPAASPTRPRSTSCAGRNAAASRFDRPDDGSLPEVLRISERFADLPFDLADASIAEAAARLKLKHLLSIDADFDVYRDRAGKPLREPAESLSKLRCG